MLNFFWRMMKNRKGFTLIELMVVVVILGILSTLAIQQIGDKSEDAKKNKAKADIRTLEAACEVYKVDNDSYPNALSALVPKYIKRIPKDPWNEEYVYISNSGSVSVYSKGPDRTDNNKSGDDISL
ncbi:MAG: type II secretion system protein GspG [Bacillota bacterium]